MLVATDVAARGLDITGLEAVINVEVSPEAEVHIHRIGRTGRAGQAGLVLNLASVDEMGRVGRIEVMQGRESQWSPLPDDDEEGKTPDGRGVATGITRRGGVLQAALLPPMVTLQILGGRKEKIRAGDVLGALTKDLGLDGACVGKIDINDFSTYVSIRRDQADQALKGLNAGKVKGRSVKVRRL